MIRRLHPLAVLLGLAGLIPFAACGLACLAEPEPRATRLLVALIGYGAAILGFLGGVHWGMPLGETVPRAERARYALGVVPALAGWLALLVTFALPTETGLVVLLVAFAAVQWVEQRAGPHGLVPRAYLRLRWALTGGVETVLAVVLVARLAGLHVRF